MNKELIGLLSVAIFIVADTAYVWSVLRGRTRPHVFSWALWSLLTGIAFLAQVSKGAGAGAWAMGVTSVVCLAIAILAIFKGERKITRSDVVAFVCGLMALSLYVTEEPLYAVIIVTLVEAFAFYPTIRKSWYKPHEEMAFTYSMDVVKYILAFLATEHYSLTAVLYPLFIIVIQSGFVAMLFYRRAVLATK